ncbi:MAG: family 10 glycosylhydrolase [Candidatus Omnitrophota bacterium]
MRKKIALMVLFILFCSVRAIAAPSRGVWVSCFTEKKVLYSRAAVLELVEFCRNSDINEIYIQLYRANQAYYDSAIADRTKYENILKSAGLDTIDLLLREAGKSDIKVFAWINVLSLSQNKEADIVKKFGTSVLTRDQYLRPSARTEAVNESDKYYLRDDQIFLEPADPRVREYIVSISNEIARRYPLLSGMHLDYIRYPYPVPYVPRSNFKRYGLTYGYGEMGIAGFKEKTGLDPLSMADEKDNFLKWDNWKRDQLTILAKAISENVKAVSKDMLVSCAVMPSPENAYSLAFQDWSGWLEEGVIDYVVLMNYTRNNRFAAEVARSALAHRGKGRVLVGIGNFLMENDRALLNEQEDLIEDLGPDGVVFFSYDSLD